jgi:hypothetical protein
MPESPPPRLPESPPPVPPSSPVPVSAPEPESELDAPSSPVPLSVDEPLSVPLPASGVGVGGGLGGGMIALQVPCTDPGGAMQGRPGQQSPFTVHDWPAAWQTFGLQLSCPLALGTHGRPPQHSVAVEDALSVAMHPTPPSPLTPVYALHRGTPNGSNSHARNFGFCGPQQLARALEMLHV